MIEIAIADDFAAAGIEVTPACIQARVAVEKKSTPLGQALRLEAELRVESLDEAPVSEVPAIGVQGLLGAHQPNVPVVEQCGGRGFEAMVEVVRLTGVRKHAAGECIVADSPDVLEPGVLEHVRLERRVADRAHGRRAVTAGQLPGVGVVFPGHPVARQDVG